MTGALPSGVTFDPATKPLSGNTAVGTDGTSTLVFNAQNGIGANAVQNFTLTVNQAPAFTSASSSIFSEGVAGSFVVVAIGSFIFPAEDSIRLKLVTGVQTCALPI